MFIKTEKEVEHQTENGRTYTRETTWDFLWNRRNKTELAPSSVEKTRGWLRHEITEGRNTLIEAAFNNFWHTPLWLALTAYLSIYTPYLLMLIPWLTPYAAGLAIAFVSYLIVALGLSYLRRFVVWGAGKLKSVLSGKGKQ